MELFIALLFGVVQGATEFLPISGGGHLAMIQNFNQTIFGEALFSPTLTFDILLRLGTLSAIIFVFFSDIKALAFALVASVKDITSGNFSLKTEDESKKLLYMLILTSAFLIPAYFLTAYTEVYLSGLHIIAITLIVTGISNLLIDKVGVKKSTNAFFEQHCGKENFSFDSASETAEEALPEITEEVLKNTQTIPEEVSVDESTLLTCEETSNSTEPSETNESTETDTSEKQRPFRQAILVGIFQLCSVIPGLSRSSLVILGSLTSGFRRDFAVKYAFLAAIPVLFTKIVLQTVTVLQDGIQMNWFPYLSGMLAAFLTGVFSIGLMRKSVRKYYCKRFGYYCFILGIIIFVIQTRG